MMEEVGEMKKERQYIWEEIQEMRKQRKQKRKERQEMIERREGPLEVSGGETKLLFLYITVFSVCFHRKSCT